MYLGDKPIAEIQGLQWKIAYMTIRLEEARRLLVAGRLSLAGPGETPPAPESATRPRRSRRSYRGGGRWRVQRNYVASKVLKGDAPASLHGAIRCNETLYVVST